MAPPAPVGPTTNVSKLEGKLVKNLAVFEMKKVLDVCFLFRLALSCYKVCAAVHSAYASSHHPSSCTARHDFPAGVFVQAELQLPWERPEVLTTGKSSTLLRGSVCQAGSLAQP
ncbi:hypothetical protein WJX73_001664 [Symbiochloris irregularis]|uniref:Uncharacterized protein n=1 Tax=Symbiochloris irregularis TaxID=706552 RepID=A0AAW1NV80_9CHLO